MTSPWFQEGRAVRQVTKGTHGNAVSSQYYVRQVALRSYAFRMRWNTEQEAAVDLLGNRYPRPSKRKAVLSRKDLTERRPDVFSMKVPIVYIRANSQNAIINCI